MPSFSTRVPDLVASGPIVQVSVGPSRELILSVPLATDLEQPHPVTAIIDTGAQTTVLNPSVVRRLHLKPVGRTSIVTPSTTVPVECNRYHVNVYFSEGYVAENIFAVEAPMGGQPYQCLIGRDVLRLGKLHYDGTANEFTLEF
jgi:predicted aspartyl protease